jgi:hypothetical protein
MKTGLKGWELRVATLTVCAISLSLIPAAAANKAADNSTNRSRIAAQYGSLPLNFEENKGQTDSRVKFLSRGSGYSLFLTPNEAVLSLNRTDKHNVIQGNVLRMQFTGSGDTAKLRAEEQRSSVSNYFRGSNPEQWITDSRHYGKIVYSGLYPGIDAVFYGNQRQLEYDIIVAPGADPSRVRMQFKGADRVWVDDAGALVLSTATGDLRQKAPVIYQDINGRRKYIDGRYLLQNGEVSFEVARYDTTKRLVIDPVLVYSTFLGGTAIEEGNAIAVDTAGNTYIVGRTESADFPFTGGPFTALKGTADAFVAKLAPAGNTAVFTNYLGGTGVDYATGVAVDAEQNIYVVGATESQTQFPTNNAYQSSPGTAVGSAGIDAFLVKFSPAGNFVSYGTYIGGLNRDVATGVTVDSTGSAYVVGVTESTNFDATGGVRSAFQGPSQIAGATDGFVMKFNPNGSRAWGTYHGGNQNDTVNAVAVDADFNVYVTGATRSLSFPVTAGVLQSTIATTQFFDAYVTKINPTGTAYVYSTYLGGSVYDEGFGIAVDADRNAYVIGDTESVNLPVLGGFQGGTGGGKDAFIAKLNPAGTARVYASYIGGNGSDSARGVALDSTGVAFVTGFTGSANFPVNSFVQATLRGSQDAFLVRVSAAGSARLSSTFLGGGFDDYGLGVAVDANANAYLTGFTHSPDFPTISALQSTFPGTRDAFVSKISNCEIVLSPASSTVSTIAGTGAVLVSGPSDCPWNVTTNAGFINITSATSGSGNGTVTFSFTANSGSPRVGQIFIGGQTYTLNQQGSAIVGCVYPPTPENVIVPAEGQAGTFLIPTATTNCAWSAVPNVNWIQVYPPTGTGQTDVSYTIYPNFSTLVRTGRVQIGSMTFNVAQSGTVLNANQRFVALVYFNFLGRYPTPSEIDFQANQLALGASRTDLVMNFFNSAEFNLGGRFIAGMYIGILNRDAEFAGWLFQREALARGGISQFQLVANFINSAEFQLRYGALSDDAYVRLLYRQILGREASQQEVNFQLSVLPGMGRVQMAVNFLNSPEFRIGNDSRLTSFLLYATLLFRQPDSAEMSFRQGQISTGTAISTLVSQFIEVREFTDQLN